MSDWTQNHDRDNPWWLCVILTAAPLVAAVAWVGVAKIGTPPVRTVETSPIVVPTVVDEDRLPTVAFVHYPI